MSTTEIDGFRRETYMTDVVDDDGVNTIIALIPNKKSLVFEKWLRGMGTSIDAKSKQKAHPGLFFVIHLLSVYTIYRRRSLLFAELRLLSFRCIAVSRLRLLVKSFLRRSLRLA